MYAGGGGGGGGGGVIMRLCVLVQHLDLCILIANKSSIHLY